MSGLFAPGAFEQIRGQLALATDPACAFCGAPNAEDVYREEDYPDAPCCADEEACHARVLSDGV